MTGTTPAFTAARRARGRFGLAAIPGAVAIASLGFAPAVHGQFMVGEPSDDVWAYEFAADPGGDPVIRLWGDSGLDLNPDGYPGPPASRAFWSYGFASWDLSDVPPGWDWQGATVTLTVADGTVYDPSENEVYLRLLTGPVDEATWVFGVGPAPVAGDAYRIAGDDSAAANGPGSLITFEIPRNLPANVLRKWAANRRMDLAFTSTAQQLGGGQILRVASRDNLLYDGPMLDLR